MTMSFYGIKLICVSECRINRKQNLFELIISKLDTVIIQFIRIKNLQDKLKTFCFKLTM